MKNLVARFAAGLLLGAGVTLAMAAAPPQILPLCGCSGPYSRQGYSMWPLAPLAGVTGGASYTPTCFQVSGTTNCRMTGTYTHTADPNPQPGMLGFWNPNNANLPPDPPSNQMPYLTGSWPIGPNNSVWGPCAGPPGPKNPIWIAIWYGGPTLHQVLDDWQCDAQ